MAMSRGRAGGHWVEARARIHSASRKATASSVSAWKLNAINETLRAKIRKTTTASKARPVKRHVAAAVRLSVPNQNTKLRNQMPGTPPRRSAVPRRRGYRKGRCSDSGELGIALNSQSATSR